MNSYPHTDTRVKKEEKKKKKRHSGVMEIARIKFTVLQNVILQEKFSTN